MSYRATKFRDVLFEIANLKNIDTSRGDLLKEDVQPWVRSINRNIPKAFKFWEWPELTITEERAFEPIWNSSKTFLRVNAETGLPDRLFYLVNRKYYAVKSTAVADPPVGTVPTSTTYFEESNPTGWFIPYDQECRRSIGEVIGIYGSDPRVNGRSVPGLDFRPTPYGIEVCPAGFGPTVFVNYRIRPPRFNYELYVPEHVYAAGDVIYWDSKSTPDLDGECYRAIRTADWFQNPTTVYWTKVLFPQVIAEYIINVAAAENAEDEQEKVDFYTVAKAALQQEADSIMAQGQRFTYGRRGRCGPRYVPYGCQGYWWSVSAPWSDTGAVSTLTDQCVNEWGDMVTVLPGINETGVIDLALSDISDASNIDMSIYDFGQLFAFTVNDSTQFRQYQSGAPVGPSDLVVFHNSGARLRQTGGS